MSRIIKRKKQQLKQIFQPSEAYLTEQHKQFLKLIEDDIQSSKYEYNMRTGRIRVLTKSRLEELKRLAEGNLGSQGTSTPTEKLDPILNETEYLPEDALVTEDNKDVPLEPHHVDTQGTECQG